MYCDYWKLERKPFKAAFDADLINFKGYFAESFHKLDLYLNNLPVALCIEGNKGSGKSAFLRIVEKSCREELHVVSLPGKYLNERVTLMRIFEESQPLSNTRSQRTLAQKISSYFSISENLQKGMLMLVDDSQYIYDDMVLKDLAEVVNLCQEKKYPVCFIFVLDSQDPGKICETIADKKIIQFGIPTTEEMKDIINYRLEKCGGKTDLFSYQALDALVTMANGDIKELLTLADLSLQMGYVNKTAQISLDLIQSKVGPFMDRFREEDEPQQTEVEARSKAADFTSFRAPKEPYAPAQEELGNFKPEKLINRTELESYRVEHIKDPIRKEIEALEKMIISGKMDLSRVLQKKESEGKEDNIEEEDIKKENNDKNEIDDKTTSNSENPLTKLDDRSFYQVGSQLVTGILDKLRHQRKVSLESSIHFSQALISRLKKDQSIFKYVHESGAGYGLNVHMLNVSILATATALNLNLSEEEIKETSLAALLHDIGHLRSGENLLNSSTRFNRQDFRTIKEHPQDGKRMIRELTDGSEKIAEIINQEHERDDGLGYPNYLVGNEIHLSAKIIAVCDVYEALTHSRSYRAAISPEEAIIRIRSGMIQQTDPGIINSLSKLVRPL